MTMAGESMLTGTSRMFLWTVPDHPVRAQSHLTDRLPNLRQQRLNSLLLNSLLRNTLHPSMNFMIMVAAASVRERWLLCSGRMTRLLAGLNM